MRTNFSQNTRTLLLTLLVFIAPLSMMATDDYIAILKSKYGKGTITFTYGEKPFREANYGRDGTYSLNGKWKDKNSSIIKLVFEEAFANARPKNVQQWFYQMSDLESDSIIGIEYFNTSELTAINGMFMYCRKIKTIDLSHFDTRKVTKMYSMFNGCTALESIDVSHLNTENVTNMNDMFSDCPNLTKLDLSTFDMGKVTQMQRLCYKCNGLKELVLGGNDFKDISDKANAFTGVGTAESPCKLIINSTFDKSVLGDLIAGENGNPDHYEWLGGYFTVEETTGIKTIQNKSSIIQDSNAVYNLRGQKVAHNLKTSLPNGLYIIGGKKIVVK